MGARAYHLIIVQCYFSRLEFVTLWVGVVIYSQSYAQLLFDTQSQTVNESSGMHIQLSSPMLDNVRLN